MSNATHRLVHVDGVRLHVVEQGEGPLVLLVHGFPELWYSWRFQLPALAAAGYRAVAIDQRGYGRSSKFWNPDAYRIHPLVRDITGLVAALDESEAFVVGHDWGAPVAWTAAWEYPELFRGVVGLSVPFSGRGLIALPGNPFGELPPDEIHQRIAGPGQDFYQVYFSGLDAVIDEIETDLRGWVRDLTWSVSGEALDAAGFTLDGMDPVQLIRGGPLCIRHGSRMRDGFATPDTLPSWFSHADLDVYTDALERGGLSGPLSYYRNLQNNWRDLAHKEGQPLEVPAMFIGGEFDVGTWWGAEAIERAPEVITHWHGAHVLERAGHWIQQERAEHCNALILDFLSRF